MKVYIEVVIIDNFVLTALICVLSYRFLRLRVSRLKVFIVSLLGTLAAIFYPFIQLSPFLLLLLKLILAIIFSIILFIKKKNIFIGCGVFLTITFMFGGLMFALGLMMHGNVALALTMPLSNIPLGVIIVTGWTMTILVKKCITKFHRSSDTDSLTFLIDIVMNGKCVKLKGFLDTGNKLYDDKSGLPVIIAPISSLLPLFDEEMLKNIMINKGERLGKNAHYMQVNTINENSTKILILKPDTIRLYFKDKVNIINDVVVGLTFSKLFGLSSEAILHPALINK